MNYFNSLIGVVLGLVRMVREVWATGVSVKQTDRASLTTSEKLKLAKSAREGGENKFAFF